LAAQAMSKDGDGRLGHKLQMVEEPQRVMGLVPLVRRVWYFVG